MSFTTRRVLVITPFYMLFEFFLLKYAFLLIGGVDDIYLLALTIFIGGIHCIPMLFEVHKSRKITRFLSTLDGVWMWASVLFLIDIIIVYLIGNFVELSFGINLIFLAIVPILGVYNYYKANKLVINEKIIILNNLKEDINIAHLSDVHFGSVHHKKTIEVVASKLKELEGTCELAIISGDFADGSSIVEENDFMALKTVNMPIIFTPGNHDHYLNIENVINASKKAGLIVLDNDVFEFKNLNVYGLTYSFEDIEMPTVDEIKRTVHTDKVNIINYHVPYNWDEFSSWGFDIQLSGHTHGGQFYPVVWFANMLFKYNKGLFKNDLGKYLHVTTGIGSMNVPMRWGTDCEIVVLKLKSN